MSKLDAYYEDMFSLIIRFTYALTYFSHVAVVGELYQLYKNWNKLSLYWDGMISEGLRSIISIHFPLIILFVLWLVFVILIKCARKYLTPLKIQIAKSDLTGFDMIFTDKSLFPYITILISFVGKNFIVILFPATVILLWLLLAHMGNFNIIAFVLGYKQYKVSTASASYWLISKKRICDFTSSYKVVEISNNVLLRI